VGWNETDRRGLCACASISVFRDGNAQSFRNSLSKSMTQSKDGRESDGDDPCGEIVRASWRWLDMVVVQSALTVIMRISKEIWGVTVQNS